MGGARDWAVDDERDGADGAGVGVELFSGLFVRMFAEIDAPDPFLSHADLRLSTFICG